MTTDHDDDGPAYPAGVRFAGVFAAGQAVLLLVLGVGLGAVGVLDVFALAGAPGVPGVPGVPGLAGGAAGEAALVAGGVFVALGCPYLGFAVSVLLRLPGAARGLGNWSVSMAAVVGGAAAFQAVNDPARLAAPAVAGGFALTLAVPGVLALTGRRQLRAWRAYHGRHGG